MPGGIAEVAKALRTAIETIDLNTLVEYANRLGDKTLGSRLGYLLGLVGRVVSPCDGVACPEDGRGDASTHPLHLVGQARSRPTGARPARYSLEN